MITPPDGWIVERTEDGVMLAAPEGPEHGLMRYAERRRPIRRASELARAAHVPAGFAQAAITAPRRLTTSEGEHAALVVRTGTLGDVAVQVFHGCVFLDDYYASLDGVARVGAGMIETVEQLLVGDLHLLGRERRRRYLYEPPRGWQGTGDDFVARWYPLDHPRNPARIFVNPALPASRELARAIVDKVAAGASVAAFTSRHGLDGEHYQLGDTHLMFLTDDRFLYGVRADFDVAAGRALVDSIEPVPRPQRGELGGLTFWAE
jgi:hypothetical protein